VKNEEAPMDLQQAVSDIIRINEHILNFWGDGGWAGDDATGMLRKSRLDWQVSLAKTIRLWCDDQGQDDADGRLILAWANLGALIEGTMKWFLCVHYDAYQGNPVKKKDTATEPDELRFYELICFFMDVVWTAAQKKRWGPFVETVRKRRNAIHAYQDRDLGSFAEFQSSIITYRSFLLEMEGQVPYPEEEYAYPCDLYQMHASESKEFINENKDQATE
jgi:hypothetical protein